MNAAWSGGLDEEDIEIMNADHRADDSDAAYNREHGVPAPAEAGVESPVVGSPSQAPAYGPQPWDVEQGCDQWFALPDSEAAAPRVHVAPTHRTILRDEYGLRIIHCHNPAPHHWHGWVGGNEDLRCPGVATYKDGRRV